MGKLFFGLGGELAGVPHWNTLCAPVQAYLMAQADRKRSLVHGQKQDSERLCHDLVELVRRR